MNKNCSITTPRWWPCTFNCLGPNDLTAASLSDMSPFLCITSELLLLFSFCGLSSAVPSEICRPGSSVFTGSASLALFCESSAGGDADSASASAVKGQQTDNKTKKALSYCFLCTWSLVQNSESKFCILYEVILG